MDIHVYDFTQKHGRWTRIFPMNVAHCIYKLAMQ
jgi:hypothetical protein